MEPEIRLLRYFLAVAADLHFGRAAERLFISQPALSQQIRKLESDLGFALFTRNRRVVTLTAAGAAMLAPARAAVDAAAEVVTEARRLARAGTATLALGYQVQLPGGVLSATVREHRRRHPGARVELRQVDFTDTSVGLLNGTSDVAVISLPVAHDLVVTPLYSEPRVVLLPEGHPLAGQTRLTLRDLVDSGLPWSQPPDDDPIWRDFWTAAAERATLGRRGAVQVEVPPTLDSMIAAVAAGDLLALTHAGLTDAYRHDGVRARPVSGLGDVTFAVARRPGDQRTEVQDLSELLTGEIRRAGLAHRDGRGRSGLRAGDEELPDRRVPGEPDRDGGGVPGGARVAESA